MSAAVDERRRGGGAGQTAAQLRKFGLVMAVPLGLLAALFWWRERWLWPWLLGAAVAFALVGLLAPRLLAPVHRLWMAFAEVLGRVMTTVILTLTFYLLVTPIGLLVRLTGKDLLSMKIEPEKESYWVPVEPDGPATRPDKPY